MNQFSNQLKFKSVTQSMALASSRFYVGVKELLENS